ncbi:MAG: hypothetical protein IPL90_03460 [Holophagales bacterium]|nr:hypothetical protein [Holophagales bacterium]
MKGSARPSRMRGARGGVVALAAALLGAGLAEASRPALRIYGVADGLKYSQVFCVVEDRDGMIWAGTSYGVSRYDGRKFESLTSRDGLPHDSVSALAVTGDGSVWAATQEGLARIAPVAGSLGEPRVVPLPPSIRESGLRPTLLAASAHELWMAEGGRVFRLREGRVEVVTLPPGLRNEDPRPGAGGGRVVLGRLRRRDRAALARERRRSRTDPAGARATGGDRPGRAGPRRPSRAWPRTPRGRKAAADSRGRDPPGG